MEYITAEILEQWGACEEDGIIPFREHFEKATLEEIAEKCIELNMDSSAIWLFNKCRELKVFEETTLKGYRNSGNRNSGDRNSGDSNSGDRNSGHRNSGHSNSGHSNSGNRNSGNRNSGHSNSGNRNSGNRNSGHRNSGDSNSGHWNSTSNESGCFNSKQDEYVRVFNKRVKREDWEKARKPNFIYNLELCYWIDESKMTNEEKKNNPNCHVLGGYLKARTYKEAWRVAYDAADPEDVEILKNLPGFDADVFEEITGVRV